MTRSEFEQARCRELVRYKEQAEYDLEHATGRNKIANARRRLESATSELNRISKEGFWNEKNEWSYSTIYSKYEDTNYVSAF